MTIRSVVLFIHVIGVLVLFIGIAFAVLLVSGIYLARRVGAFEFAWVRLSLGLIVLMGILGGPAVAFERARFDGATTCYDRPP